MCAYCTRDTQYSYLSVAQAARSDRFLGESFFQFFFFTAIFSFSPRRRLHGSADFQKRCTQDDRYWYTAELPAVQYRSDESSTSPSRGRRDLLHASRRGPMWRAQVAGSHHEIRRVRDQLRSHGHQPPAEQRQAGDRVHQMLPGRGSLHGGGQTSQRYNIMLYNVMYDHIV